LHTPLRNRIKEVIAWRVGEPNQSSQHDGQPLISKGPFFKNNNLGGFQAIRYNSALPPCFYKRLAHERSTAHLSPHRPPLAGFPLLSWPWLRSSKRIQYFWRASVLTVLLNSTVIPSLRAEARCCGESKKNRRY